MLVALKYKANPGKYTVEDVNIGYQPETLILYRKNPVPEITPENSMEIVKQDYGYKEMFRCTYTGLRYKNQWVPIYEQRLS